MLPLLLLMQSGCQPQQKTLKTTEPASVVWSLATHRDKPSPEVAAQKRGKIVYDHYCKICHGVTGQGDGFNAAMLNPPPRNFADDAFWKGANDTQLHTAIAKGGKSVGKSVLMPAWGRTLEKSQINDLIAFLHTVPALAKKAAAAEETEN